MYVYVHYTYAYQKYITHQLPITSHLIDDVIKAWNSEEQKQVGIIPEYITRETCFICNWHGYIYKDTDMFFVGGRIEVYKRPPMGNLFYVEKAKYKITIVRNKAGQIFKTNQDFSNKGDCYLEFTNEDGKVYNTYNNSAKAQQQRLRDMEEAEKEIKSINAIGNKLKTLEMYVEEKYKITFNEQLKIIGEMVTNTLPHQEVGDYLKRMKMDEEEEEEEKEEEGSVCVIV
jgi:hypothetical protein